MSIRRFVRGQLDEERLEAIGSELADRYDEDGVRIELLEADNWLSVPFVLNEHFFVKVVTRQNTMVHGLFTAGRNLGAFTSGTEGFFDHVTEPVQLAERELEATRRMRDIGVNAPAAIEVFEHEGMGVLVLEYLPEFRTLDDLTEAEAAELAPELFTALRRLADNQLAHGDLRAENVLVADGELYFIDATTVREEGLAGARAYDLACALAALTPIVGAATAVGAASEAYDADDLLAAMSFLDFVNLRPDHEFDAAAVKGEIEKAVDETG